MRICYVVSQWGRPTETFVRREVEAALAGGHEVSVLSLKPPAPTDLDVPVLHSGWGRALLDALACGARHPVTASRALLRALRGSRATTAAPNLAATVVGLGASRRLPPVDWIHAHFNWVAGTAADALATVRQQPFSVFGHAFDLFDDRFVDRHAGEKLRRAALVLVESERIAAETSSRFSCVAHVQRMGVPEAMVVADAHEREGNIVLSVGSLTPKKGHDDLVRAVAETPSLRLVVLGEGHQRAELESLARSLGVADRVALVGSVTPIEVREHLDRAAVFCLASKPTSEGDRDGVPNVLIEAMARGVPVISTAVSGIPDLLADGRGIVVEPGDVTALAAGLEQLTTDRVGAAVQAATALEHVRACYTTAVNWRELEGRIRDAMQKASAAR